MDININTCLDSITKLLNCWKYRHMSPFGKITIIKSLALSKMTHLSIILPTINDDLSTKLEKMFFNFIWDGKPDKINRKQCKMPQSKGGLNMVSVKEFWNSLKISWMRRIHISGSFWKNILANSLLKINFLIENIFYLGNHDLLRLSKLLTNSFWKNVFSCTSELLDSIPFFCPEKFGLLSICGSSVSRLEMST